MILKRLLRFRKGSPDAEFAERRSVSHTDDPPLVELSSSPMIGAVAFRHLPLGCSPAEALAEVQFELDGKFLVRARLVFASPTSLGIAWPDRVIAQTQNGSVGLLLSPTVRQRLADHLVAAFLFETRGDADR